MAIVRTTIWVGLAVSLVAPLEAQEAASAAVASPGQGDQSSIEQQVRSWVARLDARTLEQRDRAEQAILELGYAALDFLPEAGPNMAAETKARLQRIRTILAQKRADSVARASTVTLTVEDAPLAEVIEAIHAQTGNRLIDYRSNFGQRDTATRVSVQWEEVPFWRAVDHLFAQAGLEAYHYAGQAEVLAYVARANGAETPSSLVAYSEIFRFQPTRIEAYLNLQEQQRGTFLNLQVAWEPRVHPIVLKLPLDQLSVLDAEGKQLLGSGEGSLDTEVLPGVSAIDINVPLGSVTRQSQKIATMKGTMEALLPGRVETFRFDRLDSARNVRETRGGVEVVLESFRRNGDIWEASVLLRMPGEQGALQSHRGWVYNNEAFLEEPDGERVDVAGYEETYRDFDTIGISYKFVLEREAGDFQFVYRSPASIISLPVSFELTEIPLP